ncbi:MAG: calcium/sodium antiporter [Gammaproteobacteria bacterium]|jgi:cation:H+ antiporter|nr:MAG: calcium:proton antiporter [Gammaproteobacteria bacterium SG8_31]
MLLFSASTIAGFALLIWGADRFVVGAAGAARNFGLPTLLIGLTVVAIATSAPEILVSITAALHDNTELAVGNAIGSNIANIALVLGATAVVRPMIVRSTVLRREMPALLAVTLLTVMLFLDTYLGILDGIILLGGLVLVMQWLVRLGSQANDDVDPIQEEIAAEIPSDMSTGMALSWLALGLVVLLVGARMLVWGAHHIAINLGVSDLVIGLTIVAVGTSLPELAVSIVSAVKGEHDIALGNIIGSNMFNCLAVIGPAALIHPTSFSAEILGIHLPVMIALTLILFAMTYNFTGAGRISRVQGIALLGGFVWYIGYLTRIN